MGMSKLSGVVSTMPLLTGMAAAMALGAELPMIVQDDVTVAVSSLSWSMARADAAMRKERPQASGARERMGYSTKNGHNSFG